jgi:hypothetical protein
MSFADAGAMPILEPLDLVRLKRMTKVWMFTVNSASINSKLMFDGVVYAPQYDETCVILRLRGEVCEHARHKDQV